MGISLFSGRDFTRHDLPDTQQVAIINSAFARKYWPNGNAIGKRISFSTQTPKWYEIVGIVGNVKHRGLDVADSPELYIPAFQPLFAEANVPALYLAVRTVNEPSQMAAAMRTEVATIDGPADFRLHRAASIQHVSAGSVCCVSSNSCRDRNLRHHGFFGGPTHTRDWCAHGFGS
jgi:hypothetical protein